MPRRIDHLVVAVRDLDEAAELLSALWASRSERAIAIRGAPRTGSSSSPGSFIELITVGEGAAIAPHAASAFSFGAFVQDYLRTARVLPCWSSTASDAKADAALFAETGIGAFEPFSLRAERPPARRQRDRRSPSPWPSPRHRMRPMAGFFVCQQHYPENFWNPEFQRHANGRPAFRPWPWRRPDPERASQLPDGVHGRRSRTSPDGDDFVFPPGRGAHST